MTKSAGKVVLVTGGTGGLGAAMCKGLAEAGHRVVAGTRAEAIAPLHNDGAGQIQTIQCDLTDPRMCRAAVDHIVNVFGSIDVLVNNAAVGMDVARASTGNRRVPFYEAGESLWQSMMDVNVVATFRMAQLVLRHQLARGWGRIINVTTGLVTMQKEGYAPYGPSKAAVEAASVIWAKELKGTGVTVNVLTPGGPANTRAISSDDFPDRSVLIQPDAMVAPLLWLVSPAADTVTGRRYQAKLWRPELSVAEAEAAAGAAAGWA